MRQTLKLALKTITTILVLTLSQFSGTFAVAQDEDVLGLGAYSPVGRWIDDAGDALYQVELCGESGTDMCATLIQIRPGAISERNQQFIGEMVVNEAKRTKPAEWRGDINVLGTTYGGNVRVVAQNQLVVTGCVLILCEKFNLNRVADDMEFAANS